MIGLRTIGDRFCKLLVLAAGLSLVLGGCSYLAKKRYPRPEGRPEVRPRPPAAVRPSAPKPPLLSGKSYVIKGRRYHLLASARGFIQEGQASWYGRDFHGRKTANGETYDMYALTAAHKTLPLGTWVKVTNLANFQEVTVRINDRGPFVQGRIIDLSHTGAKSIGMLDQGTAPVRIEALGTAERREIGGRVETVLVQPRSYEEGRFTVQVGSFQDKDNAEVLAGRLRREFGRVRIEAFDRGDAVFHRVQVSERKTIGQAMALKARLERLGFKDCFVVAR